MPRFPTLLLLALLLTAGVAPARAPLLPSSEIRAGMRGYGLSVFRGTTIERFPVTVLGVARGYLSGSDLILVRVDGGYPVENGAGIIAGMSGSPIYLEGRLAGAIAYGWPFAKEAIGGVTPIESMLAELPGATRPLPAEAPWGAVGRLETPIQAAGQVFREVRLDPAPRKSPGALNLAPISTLLQTSGLGGRALQQLNESLQPLPITAVQGFSGPRVKRGVPPMVPGSAVGVLLLTGDVEVAGTGTLTWREGNTVLAFGHPMAQLGEVSLPLSASFVHTVMPSFNFSYKMASQLAPIGELTRDRLWAVGGRLHAPAPMIPVQMEFRDPARGRRQVWNLKAAQHPYLTGPVVAAAAGQGVGAMAPSMAETTARLHLRVEAEDLPPLDVVDMVVGPPVDGLASDVLEGTIKPLLANPYEPVKLRSVTLDVELLPGRRSATVERIYTDRPSYRPGDTVRLGVVLKPYGGERQVREMELALPVDAEKGSLKIGVGGGGEMPALRKSLSLEEPAPRDLAALVQELQSAERGQTLAVRMLLPGKGVAVGGRSLPLLPPGLRSALVTPTQSQVETDRLVLQRSQDTPWVVEGKATLSVDIEERDGPAAPKETEAKKDAAVADAGGGQAWRLEGDRLSRGEFTGTVLDEAGALTPGPSLERLYRSSDALAWSLAVDGESLLVGLAGPGDILRLRDGATTRVARTGGAAVTALDLHQDAIWAGTAPDGEVLRLAPDGSVQERRRTGAAYVWDLQGGLVATGLPGRVQSLDGDVLWDSGQQHVRALASGPDGTLYAATSGQGMVVRIDPATHEITILFQGEGVDALAWSGGHLWAGAGGSVYRLDDPPRRFPVGAAVLALAPDGEGDVWAGLADGTLVHLGEKVTRLPDREHRPVLALEAGLVARGYPAEVQRTQTAPAAVYRSEVLDAGRPARWGSLRWLATGPAEVRTRSGPTPVPDERWSPWSLALFRAGGDPIASPAARYLQLEAVLPADTLLQGFTAGFSALAARPLAAWVEPRGGERWSGVKAVKWKLLEGDPARVSYDVEASADGGATWTSLASALEAQDTFSLVTSRLADGTWILRLAAFDRADPQTRTHVVSAPLLVANSKPRINWLDATRGVALTKAAAVVDVSYRVGNGAWLPARAADGVFDSTREEFHLVLGEARRGGALEVRVRDEAGNETLEEVR